ncbi:MAG: family 78 glycoside hydrolase catalytic domain [Eubacteriales bacterium]
MHNFIGKWITDDEFFRESPRNVFHRQLERVNLPCDEHRNRHILFRKSFITDTAVKCAKIYISADDYYKLYLNGRFVAQGPAPGYHFRYPYNEIEVTDFLLPGKNVIAVHTLYQGLINRVWQSGDNRHGLILDLSVDGKTVVCSDETFRTSPHDAYRETGVVGYQTQFLESYDSGAEQVGFEKTDFDDSRWKPARIHLFDDHILTFQTSRMLEFEKIAPVSTSFEGNRMIFDFGSIYVGYLRLKATGRRGDRITVRCGQERNDDGSVRYRLRANCVYEESWILSDGESRLDWFDYKSFRYAELVLPPGCKITEVFLECRHYPFRLKATLKPEYADEPKLRQIWELCVNSQKYGVQEVIQDCMEREKGFYLGDGCYTVLTHQILTGDDSMTRKLIDDAFASSVLTPGLVTCLDCSFMQEIAEYPFMLIFLVLWHYRLTGDRSYLTVNYPKVTALLDSYRDAYEKDGLLGDLDKWCVVEWPPDFRDGYDVEITEGKICTQPHVSINAYYLEAVKTANQIAGILGHPPYRSVQPMRESFCRAFYDEERKLFRDGVDTDHISLVGNIFPFAFGLCPDKECENAVVDWLCTRKISSLSLFCAFLALEGLVRCGRSDPVKEQLSDENAWLRILREGGSTTFEGWGRDAKWNTSLFHLTLSYAAVFLADMDQSALFEQTICL